MGMTIVWEQASGSKKTHLIIYNITIYSKFNGLRYGMLFASLSLIASCLLTGENAAKLMEKEIDSESAALAREIIKYLATHPKAADTTAGITKWWLARQGYEDTIEKVQKAVDYLLSKGLLEKRTLPGGQVVYWLANKTSSPGAGSEGDVKASVAVNHTDQFAGIPSLREEKK